MKGTTCSASEALACFAIPAFGSPARHASKATSLSTSEAWRLPSRGNRVPYVIAEPCIGVKDASFVDACPVDCIHTTDEAQQHFVDPDQHIDCAPCESACPVPAAYFDADLPAEWHRLLRATLFFKN